MNKQNLHWRYFAIVFALSYPWQLVIYFTGGVDSKLIPLLMLFPAVVAIAFRLIYKEGFKSVGWGLRRWWYVLPAVVVPLVVILAIGGSLVALGWATLSDKHFVFSDGTVEIKRIPLILGNSAQGIGFFALNLVLSLSVQSLLGSVITIGEELGWRGYAQEKLTGRFGLNRGLVLLGVIWGYWHLPIGLMGWNFPAHPVLGALILTPLSTVFLGTYLGWLYLRSKSIWMPTLGHAAGNLTATLLFGELIMQKGELVLKLAFIAAWGVVAALCLISLNRGHGRVSRRIRLGELRGPERVQPPLG